MKYKMIIADYDGTTTVGNVIDKKVISAIKSYREQGGKFVICTGRAEPSIASVIKNNDLEVDAVICYQGSLIKANNKVLYESGTSYEHASIVIENMRALNKGIAGFSNGVIYYEGVDGIESYVNFYRQYLTAVKVDDLAKFAVNNKLVFQKLIVSRPAGEDFSEIKAWADETFKGEILCNSGSRTIIEFIDKRCSKYSACEKIAKYFGVDESEVITVGDSTNDLTLIEFGYGFAVKSGVSELVSKAKRLAPPINELPLIYLINLALN